MSTEVLGADTRTVRLQAGEAYLVETASPDRPDTIYSRDISGTRITANRPIGVISGNTQPRARVAAPGERARRDVSLPADLGRRREHLQRDRPRVRDLSRNDDGDDIARGDADPRSKGTAVRIDSAIVYGTPPTR